TAEEAGLTRGGIMYHFRSKDALVLAVQEHLAAEWEERLVEAAGGPAAECTVRERAVAYTRVCTESASRAELALLLDASLDERMGAPWSAVQRRWTPSPAEAAASEEAMAAFLMRLAADGLWSYDAFDSQRLDPAARALFAARIETLVPPPLPTD
ncbi:MAG: TetR/AcrR family transcriptional regulator, partial [Herbiconiux sp.]|nr:TetR/AcrR family transcriptional regulator [Herbiconiux sp.]